jgi:hypothetical protein
MEGNVSGGQYALGIVSFFTISLGGLGIGILCGLLTALITRTTSEVRGTDCSHSRAVIYQIMSLSSRDYVCRVREKLRIFLRSHTAK